MKSENFNKKEVLVSYDYKMVEKLYYKTKELLNDPELNWHDEYGLFILTQERIALDEKSI